MNPTIIVEGHQVQILPGYEEQIATFLKGKGEATIQLIARETAGEIIALRSLQELEPIMVNNGHPAEELINARLKGLRLLEVADIPAFLRETEQHLREEGITTVMMRFIA